MRQEKLDAAKVLSKTQTRDEFVVVWSETAWPPEDILVFILQCAIYSLTANQASKVDNTG